MFIQRLKDKLGNSSNASSEVEFRGAYAQMLGDPGRGVATIIEMVALTRFDCMVGSSALMRQAVAQAANHCAHRSAFGKTLTDQPLMQTVLADLILESEAALVLTMRMGRSLDQMETDEHEAALARIVTAIGKFWICKRAPAQIYEAMECMGGAGYVEESILPRLYREAPVNSIWEGSGNVQCLDVLRAIGRESTTLDVLLATIERGLGNDPDLDRGIEQLKSAFAQRDDIEARARQIVEQCALLLQAVLLVETGNQSVADAFIAARLRRRSGIYGIPLGRQTTKSLIQRAMPAIG
jgi:putative acyl-CoA dehydrogenase